MTATSKLSDFETFVIGRPDFSHPDYYLRTVISRQGEATELPVPVAAFVCPDTHDVPAEVAAAVADAELVLITVAMREGVADRVNLITGVVRACGPDSEVVFIACENKLTVAHEALIEVLDERVHHLRTVVDRVCTWKRMETQERQKLMRPDPPPFPRHVLHHEVGEWIIEQPTWDSLLPEALEDASVVEFVASSDLASYEDRKAWLVNGVHLDVALRGLVEGQADLRLVVNEPERLVEIQETVAVMAEALKRRHGMTVESEWALDRLRVVSQLPDGADRVVKDLERANPVGFLQTFEKRIAVPARLLVSGRALPPCLETLAFSLTEVMQDEDQYSDWHALRAADLSDEVDSATETAYRNAMSGWMDDDYVEREAKRLRRALRGHRGMLA